MRSQTRSRQERAASRGSADTVPIHLYGLRRGTVTVMTLISGAFAAFILAPVLWLVINATKTQANVYGTPGFWFARPFHLFQNLSALGRNVSGAGIYLQWLGNTLLYAGSAAVGATVLSAMAGYGFARFRFRGANGLFYLVMSTLLVPITSVALPLFLVYAKVGLVNSVWGMILPSMVSPVGIYLMRTYIDASVPRDLIDAARMDGASETRIFLRIVLPLTVPGLVTVLLLTVVAVWNNYFLPLIIFSRNGLYPLTVGLSSLSHAAETGSKAELVPVLIAGGLVTILPLILLFLFLEKYFRGGALQGSTTG
ncbi:carbohydrate ABC transporter permease [Actinacidiphila oryziradicis]|jgi:multiple sugar transport system permease protein|uniref:carbohydrate ABC transporter permease n=1 Tax=Actinacidiphila oryziradicis TaxID=2571141 RepID=UPI0023F0165F|nr:carbohydrate ABC transporter permease [Actinacidiphila oryziradicis]MCW2873248.1 binding-protein-dependent transport system inner rane component [Actinacidiphila oryziradicis]